MTSLARVVELNIPTVQHAGGRVSIREPKRKRVRAAWFTVVGNVGLERARLSVHIGRAFDTAHGTAQVGVPGDGGGLHAQRRRPLLAADQMTPPGLFTSRHCEVRLPAGGATDSPTSPDQCL